MNVVLLIHRCGGPPSLTREGKGIADYLIVELKIYFNRLMISKNKKYLSKGKLTKSLPLGEGVSRLVD